MLLALSACALALPARAQGLKLRELQELARQADPRAMMAYARLEAAQGKRDEARWAWFPTFATQLGFGGPTTEAKVKDEKGPVDWSNLTDGTKAGWGGQLGVQVRGQIDATLPLYTFGKLTAAQEAAGHAVEARAAQLAGDRNQAAYDVARAYWGFQTTRGAQASIEDVRRQIAEARRVAKAAIDDESEQVSASDAIRLDYIAEEVEAQGAQAVASEGLATTALKLLVGRAPEEALEVAREELPPVPAQPAVAWAIEQARRLRPDLKAAAENVAARQALVDFARANYWPDLGVVAGASFAWTSNAAAPNTPFAANSYNFQTAFVGLGLRGTFDVPQKLARTRQAEADLAEARGLQLGAERLVRLEVETALADLSAARGRAERYVKAAAIGKKLLVKSALAFDSGLGTAFDLFIDLLLFSRADAERLKGLLDAQMAWAALERAVGGPLEPGAGAPALPPAPPHSPSPAPPPPPAPSSTPSSP